MLLGDFNAKHPSWDIQSHPNTAGNRMHKFLLDFSLTQCVSGSPTRFSSDYTSCSTIDLFCTNRPDIVRDLSITDPVSDHCCVHTVLDLGLDQSASKFHRKQRSDVKTLNQVPDLAAADWDGLREAFMRFMRSCDLPCTNPCRVQQT